MLGTILFWSIRYAKQAGLINADNFADMHSAHEGRVFAAQTLYMVRLLSMCNQYLLGVSHSSSSHVRISTQRIPPPRRSLVQRLVRWMNKVV